jgi:hypothetical protein
LRYFVEMEFRCCCVASPAIIMKVRLPFSSVYDFSVKFTHCQTVTILHVLQYYPHLQPEIHFLVCCRTWWQDLYGGGGSLLGGGIIKVNLYLCLTKPHTMKTYRERGGIAPRILNLGARWIWDEWSASRAGRFTPGETAPSTFWIGGSVGSRAGLKAVAKRENIWPCRESTSGRPSSSLVTTLIKLRRNYFKIFMSKPDTCK